MIQSNNRGSVVTALAQARQLGIFSDIKEHVIGILRIGGVVAQQTELTPVELKSACERGIFQNFSPLAQ